MSQLEFNKTNFTSLAEAQAYSFNTNYITASETTGFFLKQTSVKQDETGASLGNKWDELRWIRTILPHPLSGVADAIMRRISADKGFLFDDSKVGKDNHDFLDNLVANEFISEQQKLSYLNIAVDYPYADKTQADWDALDAPNFEYPLTASTGEQVIRLNIAQSLGKTERVAICQRYGPTNDLTPWHDLATRQVRFHQDTYEVFIPACSHEVRELKICSPVALTVL